MTLAALLIAFAAPAAKAAPGDLDPTFGVGGKVLDDVAGGGDATAVTVQADGKVLSVGSTAPSGVGDFLVARYSTDGSADTSFGADGKRTTAFGAFARAFGITVQADDKIVVVGVGDGPGGGDFAVARYDSNGTLDPTFSGDGLVTTDFGGSDSAKDVRVQSDGKIVVVGTTGPGPKEGGDFAIARYETDGTLDTSFGTGGTVVTDFGGDFDIAHAVAFDSTDKILVAGTGDFAFGISRYTADGTLDTSFSGDGKQRTTFDSVSGISHLEVQPDGTIVAAGHGASGSFALAHYTASGDLDSSLGGTGKVTAPFGNARVTDVVAQPDGKLIAVGTAYSDSADDHNFALARYTTDGSIDPDFADGSLRVTDFGGQEWAAGVAVSPDSSVVTAGSGFDSDYSGDGQIALARYLGGDPALDTAPPDTAITAGPEGTTSDSTPTFSFSSSEPASRFQCSVDGAPFANCTSPHTISAVAEGAHTFAVRAIDPAGNVDPTPATRAFTLDIPDPSPLPDDNPPTSSPPAPPSAGDGTSPNRTFAPRIGRLRLNRRVVRLRGRARQRRTVLRFRLTRLARVRITLIDPKAGVRRGKRCVPRARGRRRGRRCHLVVARRSQLMQRGLNRLVLSSRMGRRPLRPGRYRILVVARNGNGHSPPRRAVLRVRRR